MYLLSDTEARSGLVDDRKALTQWTTFETVKLDQCNFSRNSKTEMSRDWNNSRTCLDDSSYKITKLQPRDCNAVNEDPA